MKKISLVLLIFLSVLFGSSLNVSSKTIKQDEYNEVAYQFFNSLKSSKDEWTDATIEESIKLIGNLDIKKGYLYRVYDKDVQKGYIVVAYLNNKIQVTEATFTGVDPIVENHKRNYYIAPFGFHTKDEFNKIMASHFYSTSQNLDTNVDDVPELLDIWPWTNPLDEQYLVPIPDELFYSFSGSFHVEQKILQTPEYFNYPYGPINNGCGPTSAAMLTSFFDRVSLPNLVPGTIPLQHSDNKLSVDNHIVLMADYLNTCDDMEIALTDPENCTGTNYNNAKDGLEQYFDDRGYSEYDAYYNTNLLDYFKVILARNPVYLRLSTIGGGHAVLGIGRGSSYPGNNFLIVRYNWTSRDGEYWVSEDQFNGFIYLSRGWYDINRKWYKNLGWFCSVDINPHDLL